MNKGDTNQNEFGTWLVVDRFALAIVFVEPIIIVDPTRDTIQ